jgi:branched-chain amino acid transport system ATP-binding protein
MVTTQTELKLEVSGITLAFGGVKALTDVSLGVREGEILAIIGPNGAGKTSLLNCINGFYRPDKGDILFQGKKITHLPTHKIAHMGIGRVFQGTQLYTGLSTIDNLMAGRHIFLKQGTLAGMLYFGPAHDEEVEQRNKVEEIIDFLEMEDIRKKPVGALPYGMRKRVDLGRALAMEPSLLLLDEPMAGMNLEEKEDMARFILDISEAKHTTMVMVEHDMGVVMDIAHRIVVLDFGIKIAEGTPQEIGANPTVINAYLGKKAQS